MARVAALLVVAVALTPAIAQAAEPGLAALEALCAPAKGDRGTAVRLADAAGWTALPDNVMPTQPGLDIVAGLKLTNFAVRSKTGPDGAMLLLVGNGEGKENEATQCVIASRRPFKAVSKAVKGWLKMPAYQSWGPGGDVYAFVDAPDGKRRLTGLGQAEADAAMSARELVILQVIGAGEASLLNYSLPER